MRATAGNFGAGTPPSNTEDDRPETEGRRYSTKRYPRPTTVSIW